MGNSQRGQVVIAPDKFKGSLTAIEVAGHVDAAVDCGFARLRTTVTGPTGVG